MLTWGGKSIPDFLRSQRFNPDSMPAWLREEFRKAQERADWEDTLDDIRALPEATVLDWPTEPGDFLR